MRSGASDEELLQIIGAAVGRKKKQHAGKMCPIHLYTDHNFKRYSNDNTKTIERASEGERVRARVSCQQLVKNRVTKFRLPSR